MSYGLADSVEVVSGPWKGRRGVIASPHVRNSVTTSDQGWWVRMAIGRATQFFYESQLEHVRSDAVTQVNQYQ